ncbi:ATP-binding cassette domain-containing protein [Vulcanisaeta sp. JCM 16159]|uniref:ATP-binding cassette domain-containing protein n=1 Tax=Vulcanisaeta sp. JCM 16159 TaxID=1295371 RepID=UPI000A71C292
MNSGDAVVWVEGLWKSFGSLVVNEDVNMRVGYGEVVSVLGPNGAGKTTLLRQVYGELRPDRGKISVMGMSLGRPGKVV